MVRFGVFNVPNLTISQIQFGISQVIFGTDHPKSKFQFGKYYGRHFYVKSPLFSADPLPFFSRSPAVFQQIPCRYSTGPPLFFSRSPAVIAAGDCRTKRSTRIFPFAIAYRIFGNSKNKFSNEN